MCLKSLVLCSLLGLATSTLLIRKCCSQTEQLQSRWMAGCAPYRGDVAPEDGPWWLDDAVQPRSSAAQPRDKPFVVEANSSSYIEYGGMQPCDASHVEVVFSHTDYYDLYDNGTLLFFPDAVNFHKNVSFGPESYCADRVESPEPLFVFLLCPCSRLACVRKCCPVNETLFINNKRKIVETSCVSDANVSAWTPEFYDDDLHLLAEQPLSLTMWHSFPDCGVDQAATVLNPMPRDLLHLWTFRNGSALVENFGWGVPFAPQHYCADESVLDDGSQVLNVVLCNPNNNTLGTDGRVYGACFIIGAVFLSATLLVHYLLPDIRGSPHAKSVMAHCASLLVAFLGLAVGQLGQVGQPGPEKDNKGCIALAFVIQWSLLAAFFWLNVMCIDISWAFSGIRALQGSVQERDRKKFLYYSLYAWGSPTAISVVTAIMDFEESIPDDPIKPNFGVAKCWFQDNKATLAYFYGPMAALLLANLLLFVFTAAKIIIVRRDTAILYEHGHQERQRFVLYGKLFLLMGVTWITEIISWAYNQESVLWYVTDLINLLRAVFIFVIFCCKPNVLALLRERAHKLLPRCCPQAPTGDSRKTSNVTQKTDISLAHVSSNKRSDRRFSDSS